MPFRVWAPAARWPELEALGERRPARAAGGGWYEARDLLPAGADYRFVVGGAAMPDPKQPGQPAGVYGASRNLYHPAAPGPTPDGAARRCPSS